jgi:hypothetical protein
MLLFIQKILNWTVKGMKHVVRFTYKTFVRLILNKNVLFKEYFMIYLISCKTKRDLLKFRNSRREMEVEGKAIPLQAWTDPSGSRRLMLPDFKTIGT